MDAMTLAQGKSNIVDVALMRFEQERYQESNEHLLGVYTDLTADSSGAFYIGRNFLYLEEYGSAEYWLRLSLSREPTFRWTHYELARLHEFRQEMLEAGREIRNFTERCASDLAPAKWNEIHIATILRIAHACFDVDRQISLPTYENIYVIGIRDYLVELRIVEHLLDAGNHSEAEKRLADIESRYDLDAWGLFAKARALSSRGRTQEVLTTLLAAAYSEPTNDSIKVFTSHRLLEFGLHSECRQYLRDVLEPLGEQKSDFRQAIFEVKFRLAVHDTQNEEVLALCASKSVQSISNWILVEALFKFAKPGEQITLNDLNAATLLARIIEEQDPFTLGSALSLHQFYSRRRRWDDLKRLDARTKNCGLFDHPEIVMRRFEATCGRVLMTEAKEMYSEYYRDRHLGQWEACIVMRFLAEAKMWREANAVLRQFLLDGYHFPDGDFFLCKICRKNDSHIDAIDAIDSHEFSALHPDVKRLRETICDDLQLRGRTDENPETAITLSSKNFFLRKPRMLSGVNSYVLYFCTDKAYFLSVLTLIASLSAYASRSLNTDWVIFFDRGVPDEWAVVATRFAQAVGIILKVVKEEEIVKENAVHVETYGIFTGGNTLSRAAFLRIYATRYLLALNKYRRALYLDSDIIANGSITDLIEHDFDGKLLFARAEEPSPEVQAAADAHGIGAAGYFNSGVLLFDLSRAEVASLLSHAIDLSENSPERLFFHDQCALNIAFSQQTNNLSPEWNFFLRPYRPDNGDFRDAKLLHFLDKPKPWDVSYVREYRPLWLTHLRLVRAILSNEDYHMIVLAANS